jgi:polyisoprenoid-binding protein YceI
MKKTLLSLVAALVSVATFAQTWSLDKVHSNVGFTITHMMISEVEGSFKSFDAKLTSTKADFTDAKFEFSADVNSINTGNDMRDGHLKSPDFFDAAKNDKLSFVSTSVKKGKGQKYTITGNLTMHGVTKPVVLAATIKGPVENPRSKKQMMGITATGKVNRIAFGVGTSGATLSDDVTFKVGGEFTKD